MPITAKKTPVALVILDGWGISESSANNAVRMAKTPCLDSLFTRYPNSRLGASGLNVGLPDGQMGNSEVGHLNIGAGRIIYQDLTRISKSISDGDFFTNPVLLAALDKIQSTDGKLHLMGLLSDGGVHSHNTHLYALIELAKQRGVKQTVIHAFLDGRDTPPKSGAGYLRELEKELHRQNYGRVSTVMGRYYAMDRDNRWERVKRAYRAMTAGEGITCSSSSEAIQGAYAAGQTDEFVEPRVIVDAKTSLLVENGDGIIFFNFRADRAREITRAFTMQDFQGFPHEPSPNLSTYVCLTEYDETFGLPIAFPSESYPNILGEVVAKAGLRQLRIAETEKYAHVTFFFNGGNETPFANEDRVLIPSPKEVATYDLKPEMSAHEVTAEVERRVGSGQYDLIILNFANPDMVGHTGKLQAAIQAMETLDGCVCRVIDAVLKQGGSLLITADHGNCEQMVDGKGEPHTAHTSNPVPLIFVSETVKDKQLTDGILADLAPTLLELLGQPKPAEMTGHNLLKS